MKLTHRWMIVGLITLVIVGGVFIFLILSIVTQRGDARPIDPQLLSSLKTISNKTIDTTHLAPGLIPPTNHWFSGIALNAEPRAVFPLPLSFQPSGSGFQFGQPAVTVSARTIMGGHMPAINIVLQSDTYRVTRYDSVSVTLTYYDHDQAVAEVTIAEGSPYITLSPKKDLAVPLGHFSKLPEPVLVSKVGEREYGVAAESSLTFHKGILSLKTGVPVVFFAVADGMDARGMAEYAHAVRSVETEYTLSPTIATTRLSYRTMNDRPTMYAALPGQFLAGAKKLKGSYRTIYGKLQLYAGTQFSFASERVDARVALDLTGLSDQQKSQLISTLQLDMTSTVLGKTDTYFGGKELYRAANLYALAEQLDQDEIATNLKSKISASLDDWFDPKGSEKRAVRYFAYDTTARGIVGEEASFGADEFNDHHFHYGYFIYAAAVLGTHDSALAKKYQPMVRLLAEEVAAPKESDKFPKWRVFDPYFGHSWASGYGQFNDGNNQESSSEAVNAWSALAVWSDMVGDKSLEDQSVWMLSREAEAARQLWTAPNLDDFDGFGHRTLGINWGGKRDYATFFSAEPAAIFGIQLIPMNPSMREVLMAQKSTITDNLNSTVPDGNYDRQFGDYLLMYRSLIDPSGALAAARELPAASIDNGNSRTYMMAWIMSQS